MQNVDPVLALTLAAIVDAGTMDAAARRLNITPSAVSQRMKTLEAQLGRVLLVRGKPARPTEAGAVVVRMARQVSLLSDDVVRALGVAGDGGRLVIPLAVNADSMATWFLRPLARLTSAHDMDFDLHRDDQSRTARLLENGEVMAAVTSEAEPVAGCTSDFLGVFRYQAVATKAFIRRWFSEGVTAEALRRAPFVDFDRGDGLQHQWLARFGVVERGVPRHYVPASYDYAEAIRLGMGWGMLPETQFGTGEEGSELNELGGPPIPVALYWQQWNIGSTVLETIAKEVADEARRVLDQNVSVGTGSSPAGLHGTGDR